MILPKDGLPSRPGSPCDVPEDDLPRPIGSRIARSTLVGVIGVGRRGVVYEAERDGRKLALKLLNPGERFDRRALGRLAQVRHPNVATVEQVGEDDGLEYCVRTYLRGDSLEALLDDMARGHSRLAHLSPLAPGGAGRGRGFYRHVATLFADVAEGLACAHGEGPDAPSVIHGRIHPANLIFSPSGRLVLCDFEGGPAIHDVPDRIRSVRSRSMAPGRERLEYMAPEQVDALRSGVPVPHDASTDVWALGAVLRGVVQGFVSAGGVETRSPGLDAVIARATSGDVRERYRSASELARDLDRLLDLESIEVVPRAFAHATKRAPAPSSAFRPEIDVELDARVPEIGGEVVDEVDPTIESAVDRAIDDRAIECAPDAPPIDSEREKLPAYAGFGAVSLAPGGDATEDDETHVATQRSLLLGDDAAFGDEDLDDAATSRAGRPARRFRVAAALAAALLVLLTGIGFRAVLVLRDRAAMYERELGVSLERSERLDRGVDRLEAALAAVSADDPVAAADAVWEARAFLGGRAELAPIETRLRDSGNDPLLAGLADSNPAVRLESIRMLRADALAGRRPEDVVEEIACRLWDEDPRVRSEAIDACADAGLFDVVLAVYPIDAPSASLELDVTTFVALYRALGDAAEAGHLGARESLGRFEVDALIALDAAVAGGAGDAVDVAPAIRVSTASAEEGTSFTRAWLEAWSRVDEDELLHGVDRIACLESWRELLPDVVAALERAGGDAALERLHRLLAEQVLVVGPRIVEALRRAGEIPVLLELLSEELPLALRKMALRESFLAAGPEELRRIAGVMRRHPDVEIRLEAFEGLAASRYFEEKPERLRDVLGDPALRSVALRHLEEHPQPEAVPALVRLLDSSSTDHRIWVVRALASTGDPGALQPIARQLFESDARLRRATLEALVRLGDDRALPLAVGILGRGDPRVVVLARSLLALPRDRRREAPQILVVALQDLFDLIGPVGESLGIGELRRTICLASLGHDLTQLDRRIPERIRRIVERPRE